MQNKPNENEVEWIYKNIEDIQPGDLVKAYDPLTKRMVDLPVTELDTHNFDEFINGETTGFAIEADPNNVISYLVINCVPESSLNDDTSNSGSENPYVKNSDDDPLIKTYSLRASIYSTFFGNIEDGPRIIDDDNNDRSGDNNDNSGSSDYPDMVTLKVTPNHPIWVSYTSEENEDYGGSQPTNKKQEMEDGQKDTRLGSCR